MSRFLPWLTTFLQARRSPARRSAPRKAVRPTVEALENRLVPTITFLQQYGIQAYSNTQAVMNYDVPVYLLFWGSYWKNTTSDPEGATPTEQEVQQDIQSILGGPYLNTLKQYGATGKAYIADVVVDGNSEPPAGLNNGDLKNELLDHGLPEPDDFDNAPVYCVITPPNFKSTDSGFTGASHNTKYWWDGDAGVDPDSMPLIWLGGLQPYGMPQNGNYPDGNPKDGTVRDWYSTNFSHELAETITDVGDNGTSILASGGFVNKFGLSQTGTQIGDNEATQYTYRVNGVLTQSLWSLGDGENYVVADGNTTNFNVDTKDNNILNIQGVQNGQTNAGITFDVVTAGPRQGSLRVTMDTPHGPETAQFEPNQISAIQVNLGDGQDMVDVKNLPANVSLSITKGTSGQVTVQLGPNAQNLANNITLFRADGNATFTLAGSYTGPVTDSLNGVGPDSGILSVGRLAVIYDGFPSVTLSPTGTISRLTLQGSSFTSEQTTVTDAGTGSVWLDGRKGIKYSGVLELDDLTPAQSATYEFTGDDRFLGVTTTSVQVVDGPVVGGFQTTSLQQFFRRLGVAVMDPVNFAGKMNVTVQGGWQDITVGVIGVNNPNPAAGLATLAIDPGRGGILVNVAATPATVVTTVTNSGVSGNVETVTLKESGNGVQAIRGKVVVQNPNPNYGGKTNLIVDDTGDRTPQTAISLKDTELDGLAPAAITWDGIASLTVTGGSGGNAFSLLSFGKSPLTTLNAGSGGDSFTVQAFATSAYQLTINGGPGYDQLFIDVMTPGTKVFQTSTTVYLSNPSAPHGGNSTISYTDVEKVDVNQVTGLPPPPPGGGGDGGGNGPPAPGGQSPAGVESPHKPRKKRGHPRRQRHGVRHLKQTGQTNRK
jgi:hypothetical protein